jgi:hypothetical protein
MLFIFFLVAISGCSDQPVSGPDTSGVVSPPSVPKYWKKMERVLKNDFGDEWSRTFFSDFDSAVRMTKDFPERLDKNDKK